MTENNGRIRQKNVMSKKDLGITTQGRKKEIGTLLRGNDKNNVIVNNLFVKLFI